MYIAEWWRRNYEGGAWSGRDRDLCTPFVARLSRELLDHLKSVGSLPPGAKANLVVQTLDSRPDPTRNRKGRVTDDWPSNTARLGILRKLLQGMVHLTVTEKPNRELDHARQLKLTWHDGQSMLVRLDEGLGFLESSARFDVTRSVPAQASDLLATNFRVNRVRSQIATYMYLQDV